MDKLFTDLRKLNKNSDITTEENISKASEQTFLNDSELKVQKLTFQNSDAVLKEYTNKSIYPALVKHLQYVADNVAKLDCD